jgi:hypothetical protein
MIATANIMPDHTLTIKKGKKLHMIEPFIHSLNSLHAGQAEQ